MSETNLASTDRAEHNSSCRLAVSLHFTSFSVLPDKLPTEQREKNPERVAAGLKASIHNPHVSKEAKESAAEKLQQLERQQQRSQHESSGHVLGAHQFLQ